MITSWKTSLTLSVICFLLQFFQLSDNKGGKSGSKVVEDDIYSVPPDVLHSISKNFSELEQEFEKVASAVDGDADIDPSKVNEFQQGPNRLKRFLRIKSVRSFSDQPNLPPKGTVARILIQVRNQNLFR